ncbi:toxic anion resistance protein [Lactobacillus sp. CC-MHH1034]|uniref:toxic anion resistance protein n=1 Tax=Agrilactobacillus fermenti TaxID=2586909 RepID=UPI001E57F895|nr:toxic anion resistance protein [Agrilactobacillus fermenti]MCD2255300.1 toxic anion resistance protein [Agrilactobacillus fermenti]
MAENQNKQATTDDLMNDLLADPFTKQTPQVNPKQQAAPNSSILEKLPPEDQQKAQELAKSIDTTNTTSVINYGAQAQKQLGEFSQNILTKVQSQDTGEIGDALTDLMYRLNEANPDELRAEDRNVFKKLFGKVKRSIFEIQNKYQKIGAQIDGIAAKLNNEKNSLLTDNVTMEELYQQNKTYFQALNIYIAAGQVKIKELDQQLIPEAEQKAKTTQDQMDVQTVQDLQQFKNRLEKRTYDLELARQVTLQQAPQIRLIQNTNQALAEKIQASINTAIPLWKNQVAIALTLLRQKDAVTAQRQVSETTNDLLKKNSEMLKMSSIETAKENERGVIDIETLQKTQNDLVETLQETLKIQKEGREKRQNAELELNRMEDNLHDQLLQITTNQKSNPTGPKDVTG